MESGQEEVDLQMREGGGRNGGVRLGGGRVEDIALAPPPARRQEGRDRTREVDSLGDELPEARGTRSLRPPPRSLDLPVTDVSRSSPPLGPASHHPLPRPEAGLYPLTESVLGFVLSQPVSLRVSSRLLVSVPRLRLSLSPSLSLNFLYASIFLLPAAPTASLSFASCFPGSTSQLSTSLTPCLFLCVFFPDLLSTDL